VEENWGGRSSSLLVSLYHCLNFHLFCLSEYDIVHYWHLVPMTGMMHVYSIYAFCLLMLPPRGIVLSQCGCHHSFMPVAFSCSPQRVLVLMCCQNCPFSFTLKTLKNRYQVKIWSLIGQYLEICVCPWEPARTFCCHFIRLFHWRIGPKINLCQW